MKCLKLSNNFELGKNAYIHSVVVTTSVQACAGNVLEEMSRGVQYHVLLVSKRK